LGIFYVHFFFLRGIFLYLGKQEDGRREKRSTKEEAFWWGL
jgi:hypothetical protein